VLQSKPVQLECKN